MQFVWRHIVIQNTRKRKRKNNKNLPLELVHIQKQLHIHFLLETQMNYSTKSKNNSSCTKMYMLQTSIKSRCSYIILHHFQSSAQPTRQKHHVGSAIPLTCRNVALVHRRHGTYTSMSLPFPSQTSGHNLYRSFEPDHCGEAGTAQSTSPKLQPSQIIENCHYLDIFTTCCRPCIINIPSRSRSLPAKSMFI